jgi:hypothetical protein
MTTSAQLRKHPLTPWGPSDRVDRIDGDDIIWVSTPGHGGLGIRPEIAKVRLSPEAIAKGIHQYGWLWYEEDCRWAIPAYELPHVGNAIHADPAYVFKCISTWDADYFLARGVTPDPHCYKRYQQMHLDDQMRAEKHPDLIVSALNEDHRPGVVKVWTADGKTHFVTQESYRARKDREGVNLLSNCILVK